MGKGFDGNFTWMRTELMNGRPSFDLVADRMGNDNDHNDMNFFGFDSVTILIFTNLLFDMYYAIV